MSSEQFRERPGPTDVANAPMPSRVHDILMITYKRPAYTKMALERLMATCDAAMRVWIWQNGDYPETLEVIREFSNYPSFYRLEISPENRQLRDPTNWFWAHSDGDYLTKVDDDCLLDDGWAQKLVAAHEANPKLGIIAAWRFYDSDFDEPAARKKIREFNGHRLMLNCWVQGSGYVMKRAVYEDIGPIGPNETFSDYGLRAALRGWVNGWYYPFIHEEHMDDARSPFYPFHTEEEFRANLPLTAVNQGITSLEQWREISRRLARSLQSASPDPRSYIGWRRVRSKIARRIRRLAGNHNFD